MNFSYYAFSINYNKSLSSFATALFSVMSITAFINYNNKRKKMKLYEFYLIPSTKVYTVYTRV